VVYRRDEFVHQLEYLGDVACVGDAIDEGHGLTSSEPRW
jgi:hypothetical protein